MKQPIFIRRLVNRNRSPKCLWPFFDVFIRELYPNNVVNILIGFSLLHFGTIKSIFHYLKSTKLTNPEFLDVMACSCALCFGCFLFEHMLSIYFLKHILWGWGLKMIKFPLIKSKKAWMWISYLSKNMNRLFNVEWFPCIPLLTS